MAKNPSSADIVSVGPGGFTIGEPPRVAEPGCFTIEEPAKLPNPAVVRLRNPRAETSDCTIQEPLRLPSPAVVLVVMSNGGRPCVLALLPLGIPMHRPLGPLEPRVSSTRTPGDSLATISWGLSHGAAGLFPCHGGHFGTFWSHPDQSWKSWAHLGGSWLPPSRASGLPKQGWLGGLVRESHGGLQASPCIRSGTNFDPLVCHRHHHHPTFLRPTPPY